MSERIFYKILITISLLICGLFSVNGQSPPFDRGVNLTGWFQVNSAKEIHFRQYTKNDFENIQSLGFDVIRLPINLKGMTNGAPDYVIDPIFFTFLDSAVNWAEELQLHLILDNHTFSVTENTLPNDVEYLKKVWRQMASHYKSASPLIYYEILNEPHGISDAVWNGMQQEVIDEIRKVDNVHTLIVGPAGWNSYNNLTAMPEYEDDNLIYTFHFYDPFIFTHQGASWVDPSMVPLAGVPFPYAQHKMPPLDDSFNGTWIESSFNNYQNEGAVPHVKALIDKAVQFRNSRNVPVFCGEFGVLMNNSNPEDRVFWYNEVQDYLEENNISWTMWDYHGGFGIFEKNSNGLFNHDLNVPLLEALDLVVPEQTPYQSTPETGGIFIYDDYIGTDILNASWTEGGLDFFSDHQPNNGNYIIHWTGADPYNNIAFDFNPDVDLSFLAQEGYAVDLFVRGLDLPDEFSFDIRFIDTKTGGDDHPWRSRITINTSMIAFDGVWHHLYLPLNEFIEQGSWDNETWYNPQGKFDWSTIDRLEISNEAMHLGEGSLWFDNIFILNQDTAQVRNEIMIDAHFPSEIEEPVTSINLQKGETNLYVYPNPAVNFLRIKVFNKNLEATDILSIYNLAGNLIASIVPKDTSSYFIDMINIDSGIYFFRIPTLNQSGKFIKP